MKTKRFLTTTVLLFAALFTTIHAQTKSITIDSIETITEEIITGVLNNINIDSIIDSRIEDLDKAVKIITVITDSLEKTAKSYTYSINSNDTVFKAVSGSIGIDAITDEDMNVIINIDTLKDGKIVKKITISSSGDVPDAEQIVVMSAGDDAEVIHGNHVMIMKGDDDNEEIIWHTKNSSTPKETLNTVPVADLYLLKKAGFSANTITSEPLELKSLNVNIERKKTSDTDILNLSLEMTMPENDKATVTLIDCNGAKKEEKSFKDSDKVSVKFEMNKKSTPYYIVVLQDKKVWTKKIEF